MSNSILERLRSDFELAELNEAAVGHVLGEKPNGQKAKVWQQHQIAKHVANMNYYYNDVDTLCRDEEGKMAPELDAIKGNAMFDSFYEKLHSIQDFHVRNPNAVANYVPNVDSTVEVPFSGEEVFGKYLDLTEHHARYCNLPHLNAREVDYLQYLEKFNTFFYIQENVKRHKAYAVYVQELSGYLSHFFQRVQPLVDIGETLLEWKGAFEANWANGKVDGWKFAHSQGAAAGAGGGQPQALRLGMYNSVEELEALGLNRLKEALQASNLKCGGTLTERAERLWSVRGVKWEDIPNKIKAGGAKGGKADGTAASAGDAAEAGGHMGGAAQFKEVAWQEFYIQSLTEMMMDVVIATRKHSEKQQGRSAEERERELLEEEFGLLPDVQSATNALGEVAEGEEEDDDEPIYNPLNIPLGWDGKPIPYWLYKLHGLGVEYKCEICGNQSYWGRRAFDKHFQEWKHAYGMRCLGIPNTKHFHDITLIADAMALHAKIKDSVKAEQFQGDNDEEFEDSEGNVLNRRTYEDLARQGLL